MRTFNKHHDLQDLPIRFVGVHPLEVLHITEQQTKEQAQNLINACYVNPVTALQIMEHANNMLETLETQSRMLIQQLVDNRN